MDNPELDERLLARLIGCRNTLLHQLGEQHPPPEIYAPRLWEAQRLIGEVIEEMKQAAGVEEPLGDTGWTTDPNASR